MFNKLRIRVAAIVAIMVIVVLGSTVFMSNYYTSTMFEDYVKNKEQKIVGSNAELLSNILLQEKLKVVTYANTDEVKSMNWDTMKSFLER
jgi:hypothetical protein